MTIDNSPRDPGSSDKTQRSVMEVLNSQGALVLYRTSSFLLLALVSMCAWVATGAIGDLRELTVEVRRLNEKLAVMIGDIRVTESTIRNIDNRVGELEKWRYLQPR